MTTTRNVEAGADRESTREVGPWGRRALVVNAALAWVGVALTTVLVLLGAYAPAEPVDGIYGVHPDGFAGLWSRLSDHVSYFTIWSNTVVAVGTTLLARDPDRDTFVRRVLRLDGVLMITVTAIVYAALLRPTAVITGWSRLTDPILHVAVPALTVAVWLAVGPRRRVTWRVVLAALALPLLWIGWMMARGAAVGAYPYGFANVAERGYGPVAVTLLGILAFGLAVAATYWALDATIARLTQGRGSGVTPRTRPPA